MKRKIGSIALAISMLTMYSVTSFAMNDINEHWAKDSINKLVKEEVIKGYQDNTFRPDKKITREEVSELIYRYFNKLIESENSTVKLSDISGRWSEDSITALSKANIIKGYPNGTFLPEKEVTRAELTTMILNALNNSDNYEDNGLNVETTDISKHWAEQNIIKLTRMGIIKGYPDKTFAPEDTATRAEVVSMLNNVNISIDERNYSEAKTSYTVKFVTDSKGTLEGEISYKVKEKDTLLSVPKVKPKGDYEFIGWRIKGENDLLKDADVKSSKFTKDITYEAVYEEKSDKENEVHTVKFSAGKNSTLKGSTSFSVKNGKKISSLPEVTPEEGFKFTDLWKQKGTERRYSTEDIKNKEIFSDIEFESVVFLKEDVHPDYKIQDYGEGIKILEYIGKDKNVEIPEEIKGRKVIEVGFGAFENKGIDSIKISKNITKIDIAAFKENNITKLEIPDNVKVVGDSAFQDNLISEVKLSESMELIDGQTFDKNKLKSVVIPKSIKTISSNAFMRNELESVDFSKADKLEKIGHNAFSYNELKSVDIPESIKELESSVFSNNLLTNIEIPSSVNRIRMYAFSNNRLENVTLHDSIVSIEESAFSGNVLKEVVIPNSVREIGRYAFSNNILNEVIIPDSVIEIDSYAFNNNETLVDKEVILPKIFKDKNISNIFDKGVIIKYRE